MRVGILGMAGRMGRLLIEEARSAKHEVVGGTLNPASATSAPAGVPVMTLPELAEAVEAVIDFTNAAAVPLHAEVLRTSRAIWVVGTTGLSAMQEEVLASAATCIPVMYAANFGLGINLLAAFARRLGAVLPPETYDAEIVEMHHRQKVDAPSGSALALGRAVAEGRRTTLEAAMDSARNGHAGPRRIGAIGFAALRGGQVVGEHTVLFASEHEHIALTHRALDRRVFAAGAVRAMEWTVGKPPGVYSIDDVLGLRGVQPT